MSFLEWRLAAYELRQKSALAGARVIREALPSMPDWKLRREAARIVRRIEACALTQRFFLVTKRGEASRLVFMSKRACKNRFICPPCARTAAGKHRKKLRELLEIVWDIGPKTIRAIFLTLTVKSRPALTDLPAMHAELVAAYKRFFELDAIKNNILGHYGTLELTVGRNRRGEPMAHLHWHVLIAVDGADYFTTGASKIKHAEWRRRWRDACRLTYLPQVNVQAVRDASGATDFHAVKHSAIELSKYIVSPSVFEHTPDGITSDAMVLVTITQSLKRQRLARFGGIFSDAMKIRRKAKKAEATHSPDPAE